MGEYRKSSLSVLFLTRFTYWRSVWGEQEKMPPLFFPEHCLCLGIPGETRPEFGGHWKLPCGD